MFEQLPALQVVLPLIAAPIVVLCRRAGLAWLITLLVAWASFAISLLLYGQVSSQGLISYVHGDWPAPWGIEYRIDQLNAFVLVLVSGVAAVVLPYALRSTTAEIPRERHYLHYALLLLCLSGLLGITITGDAFNLFVFMEISSLAMYVLIALGSHRRALLSAYQYLIMGTLGATFYVIGVGMLYLMTGTLNIADLAERVPALGDTRVVYAALAFITAGISLKLALFPLHFWLPNAYTYAPSAVSAFIAATATKVSVYVLLRYFFFVFDTAETGGAELSQILMVLAVAGIVIASLVACYQYDLKRMFAFSSVAQVGYIILGISFVNQEGLTAAVTHLFNHGITKGALFLLLGIVSVRAGSANFANVAGLARRMPLTSFGIVIAGLSLIGVPGTAGFISKWYLILAAIESEQLWLVALIVGSSLLALIYVWRFVEAAYLREPSAETPTQAAPSLSMLIPAWVLVAACVWFGFDTSFNGAGATAAARLMLGAP